MRLTAKTVGDILEGTLGYRVEMNPYGFELLRDDPAPRNARLQRGSGIGGRGDVWALVQLPDGTPIATGISTRAKLTRVVLEFMAGPRPRDLTDHTMPRAKRMIHPLTREARFVWYRRRKKQPRKRVLLVPFGAAQR